MQNRQKLMHINHENDLKPHFSPFLALNGPFLGQHVFFSQKSENVTFLHLFQAKGADTITGVRGAGGDLGVTKYFRVLWGGYEIFFDFKRGHEIFFLSLTFWGSRNYLFLFVPITFFPLGVTKYFPANFFKF